MAGDGLQQTISARQVKLPTTLIALLTVSEIMSGLLLEARSKTTLENSRSEPSDGSLPQIGASDSNGSPPSFP